MQVQSLGQKDPLEEGMATHASILTWRIPWTEEPGGYSPLSMEYPRQEYWMGFHFLLQGILPPQGSNPCLMLGR